MLRVGRLDQSVVIALRVGSLRLHLTARAIIRPPLLAVGRLQA